MASDANLGAGVPERLGRYELLTRLGVGGMATVYLARTVVVGDVHRLVALKLMHPELDADGGDGAKILLDEATLAARIEHPNVVRVLEAARGEGRVYLVMDYTEGDTLAGLLRRAAEARERIPTPIVARIAVDVLAGLHAAHELTDDGRLVNLVHRDFTPSNILVGVDGVTRLADFGVAKAESRASGTATGQVKGKLGYMAPEQVRGEALDRRCDVWAAGVVVWECLVGRRLFQGDDMLAVMLRMARERPPKLRSLRPELSPALDEAVASALTQELARRCPTAAELRDRLLEAFQVEGAIADNAEVGAYVRRACEPKLVELRGRVAAAIAARSERSMSSSSERVPSVDSPRIADQVATVIEPAARAEAKRGELTEHATQTAGTIDVAPRRGAPRRWLLATGVLASAAILGLGVRATRDAPSATQTSAVAPSSTSLETATPLASREDAPPLAPTTRAAVDGALLVVHADAPMKTLQIDGRTIALVEATSEISVRLATRAPGSKTRVQATTADGRRAGIDVAPDAEEARIAFPPPSAVRSSRAKGPATAQPGLAPTPYEGP